MGDCGQLWEEFLKRHRIAQQGSFTSPLMFFHRTQSFFQIFWLLFYLLRRIRYPSNPDATICPMVKFHKNILAFGHFFPPKTNNFFSIDSRCCRIWWNAGLFIFHWKKSFSMGLKRRVHHVSLDPIRYTSLLCLISVQIFLLISSFFRPLHLFAVGGETKNSMECLLDNSKQNARAHLFFDRLYQAKNMLN